MSELLSGGEGVVEEGQRGEGVDEGGEGVVEVGGGEEEEKLIIK